MASKLRSITDSYADNDTDSKEIKKQPQRRSRNESSSPIRKSGKDSRTSKSEMLSLDDKRTVFSSSFSSSSFASPSLSSSSSSFSSSFSASDYQTFTSKSAAYEASKLNFQAERGPFPFKKQPTPSNLITIMESTKDGTRIVESIRRLKNNFYPVAYDTSKKEVLFQASQNEFFTHETEAGRKYKDWFHIQKHARQVLEKNAQDQQALKEKALEQNGYSQELKNDLDALLAEEVLMLRKLLMPQPKKPPIVQEAITITSEMRLPLGLYACESGDLDSEQTYIPNSNNDSSTISTSSSSSSSYSLFSSCFSFSSSCSSSSSSSTSNTTQHNTYSQSTQFRTYEIRLTTLATVLHNEERIEYKVAVEKWDKTIHHIEIKDVLPPTKLDRTFSGHAGSVWGICTIDKERFCVASHDKMLKIMNIKKGTCERILSERADNVGACVYLPTLQCVAAGIHYGSICFFNVVSGQQIHEIENAHNDHICRLISLDNGHRLVSTGYNEDATIKVWDTSKYKRLHTLRGHASGTRALCMLKKSGWLASGSTDKNIKLWDLSKGECVATLTGHTDAIGGLVQLSHQDNVFVSCSIQHTLKVWDTSSLQCIVTIDCDDYLYTMCSLSLSNNNMANNTDSHFDPYDMDNDNCEGQHVKHDYVAVGGYSGTIQIYDLNSKVLQISNEKKETIQPVYKLSAHSAAVYTLCYSPLSNQLVSGSADTTFKVWSSTSSL